MSIVKYMYGIIVVWHMCIFDLRVGVQFCVIYYLHMWPSLVRPYVHIFLSLCACVKHLAACHSYKINIILEKNV